MAETAVTTRKINNLEDVHCVRDAGAMGDSNSCPSVGKCAVYAREILTQIEGQLKGHSGGGVVGDDRRRPAMQESLIYRAFLDVVATAGDVE
jgi:hypothetical protein